MEYIDYSCRAFAGALASKQPAPGGGGASALAGALGMALGEMVGSLTLGKKKYAAVQGEIEAMMAEALALREQLLALVQLDAAAFEPLAAAYGLPSATEAEKAEKETALQGALYGACEVPLAIMEKCCRAVDLLEGFAQKGSVLAQSDAGAGAALCGAALQGASLNVFINTKAMADREKAGEFNRRAEGMLEEYTAKAGAVFALVRSELR